MAPSSSPSESPFDSMTLIIALWILLTATCCVCFISLLIVVVIALRKNSRQKSVSNDHDERRSIVEQPEAVELQRKSIVNVVAIEEEEEKGDGVESVDDEPSYNASELFVNGVDEEKKEDSFSDDDDEGDVDHQNLFDEGMRGREMTTGDVVLRESMSRSEHDQTRRDTLAVDERNWKIQSMDVDCIQNDNEDNGRSSGDV